MNEIQSWSNTNKFQLHPTKCKELCISFSRNKPSHDPVNVGTINCVVESVQSFKILGVTLQNDLKWNLHIETTIKKPSKRMYFLIQLKRADVSASELTSFYVACIQFVLIFAYRSGVPF